MRSISRLLAVVAVLGAPSATAAPQALDPRYKAGLAAEAEQDFERALAIYEAIPVGERTIFTRLHIATCKVRLGRFVDAEADLTNLVQDPAASVVRETAQSDLADLRARMPRLTIRMAAGSSSDVWITVDGKPVGPPVTIPLDPGQHQVVGTRAGVEVYRQKVALQDSQAVEVEVEVAAAANAPVAAAVGSVETTAPRRDALGPQRFEDRPHPMRRWAVPAFTSGAALAVLSGVSFVLVLRAQNDLKTGCGAQDTPLCDTDAAGAGRLRTFETIGWISGGAAVASLSLGAVALLIGRDPKSPQIVPVTGAHGIAVRVRF
jgi:hypothetical protein